MAATSLYDNLLATKNSFVTQAGIEDVYQLSPMQQGMLFNYLYAPQSGVDIVQMICTLHEDLNVPNFERAWRRVVERHAVLRTSFRWEHLREPLQEVHQHVALPLKREDWRDRSAMEQEKQLAEYLEADRRSGFDLTEAPLMRIALFHAAEADHRCVWTFHHAVLDGRSFPLILKEVFALYEAYCRGEDLQLKLPRLYRDFIGWLQQQDLSKAEAFWRQSLKGFTAPTPLIVDRASGNERDEAEGRGARAIVLPETATSALRSAAQKYELTLNTMVQGAWALLLSRYSGEEDVIFGATRACRRSTLDEAESMVGLFINTLPIRVRMPPGMSVLTLLKDLRAQQVALREYEHTSLVKVERWSDVPGGMPLFETLLVFENYLLNSALRALGGRWENREFRLAEQPNYPLTICIYSDAYLLIKAYYDRQRFDDATIERMLGHFQTLLENMATNLEPSLCDLPLLTDSERHQLLVEWNNTTVEYPRGQGLHELFEEQVECSPDAIAVIFEGKQLTYQQLNARANQVAHHLRKRGVGPEVLVGICLERSVEMVVALLGILKAGGAYVPLDPSYPQERLSFMLTDTGAPVLLTQARLVKDLPDHRAEVICLDTDWDEIAQEPEENPASGVTAENLAYLIFTSGSTGQPKGVLISHYNVTRLFEATRELFNFNNGDVWTLFHSYAFDFSVWELWGALLHGGRLVVVPYLVSRSPEEFYDLLCREQVTVLNQTPSAFRQLMQAEQSTGAAKELALRLVIFGGEALEVQSLKPWFDRRGDEHPRLINMYGITETTVHVTYRRLTRADLSAISGSVIGRAIPDLRIYVLDQQRRPVPVGVPGEIYVGGTGLARGYLNRPELTAERFVPDPFSSEDGARLYKTGDLARYLPDGDIEYLGRLDHQVKVRGFRIELGEIEAVLSGHQGVRTSVVIAKEDAPGDKRLIAYLVVEQEQSPSISELRSFLKQKLPEYMVPSAFVMLGEMPLTPNGKVDRRALPEAPNCCLNSETGYLAPRTEVEQKIAAVWQETLGVEKVGINNNFFDLGGHSILIVHVHSKLRRALNVDLSIIKMFQYPTISSLAKHLSEELSEQASYQGVKSRAMRQKDALARQKKITRR